MANQRGQIVMSDDEEFTPRLGRMRNRGGGKRARRYLSTVVAAAAPAALLVAVVGAIGRTVAAAGFGLAGAA